MSVFLPIMGKENRAELRLITSNLNLEMGQQTLKSKDAEGGVDMLNVCCIKEKKKEKKYDQ